MADERVDVAAAIAACEILVEAYAEGEDSDGSVEWSALDAAHEQALKALGRA